MASAAPTYVLRYFPVIGFAEPIRVLLAAAGVEWTEEHPEWPQEKPNQPFGRMPVLIEKTEGKPDFVISESQTIARYLARKYGFLPADLQEAAMQEQFFDQQHDVVADFNKCETLAEGEDRRERRKDVDEILDKLIEVQTAILQRNGNTGRMFGDGLSLADAASYGFYKVFMIGFVRLQADIANVIRAKLTPEIVKHLALVEADPALKAHTDKAESLMAVVQPQPGKL
ncbi:hypothetical protein H4R18_001663 [Coemansia javaensis]|uniref:GST N-terminal domain-containing protein n=1 Tax=Coemansia javaensis TaxID=2761396 RepID=A0A9W8HEC9_9FUNG|nr:hypothetical protein H4R18_001663 [Coemansia javaensis]